MNDKKPVVDTDLLVESLRLNLSQVQKEISALQQKEEKIKKEIDTVVNRL